MLLRWFFFVGWCQACNSSLLFQYAGKVVLEIDQNSTVKAQAISVQSVVAQTVSALQYQGVLGLQRVQGIGPSLIPVVCLVL